MQTSSDEERVDPEPSVTPEDPPVEDLVDEELLVEEISIDGMCGVY